MAVRHFYNNSTVVKCFNFSTLAHLGVEGVGLANGGFSVSLIVKEENIEGGGIFMFQPQGEVMLQKRQVMESFYFGVR